MALFQVTVKRKKQCGGVHLEPGMTVQVATQNAVNPLVNNKQMIVDAFMRVYGVDLRKAMALSPIDLDIVKVGN
jgi:hypothetical protein